MNFSSPFLILKLVNFIKAGDQLSSGAPFQLEWDEIKEGVYYSLALILTQLASYVASEHLSYFNVMTGRRSSNAVIAAIYEKYSYISSATNKEFSSGQIINFV